MAENKDKIYIREQIVEKKRKPWMTSVFVGMGIVAVVLASCVAGSSYAYVMHKLDHKDEETEPLPSHTISYHETEEEIMEDTTEYEEMSVAQEWLDSYLDKRQYTIVDVEKMEDALNDVYENIQKSMVTIDVRAQNNTTKIAGVIASATEQEAIILVDGMEFQDDAVFVAYPNTYKERILDVRQKDSVTGMIALAMSLENFSESEYKKLQVITIGNSNRMNIGNVVILAGSPLGICGSMQYGTISYIEKNIGVVDGEVRLLWTDCLKQEQSSGAMFNLHGELVGWLQSSSNDFFQKAIGITDLKNVIEDVISGKNSAYLGVKGCAVTESMSANYGMPKGIYITEVQAMSAAYEGGIQMGDLITEINDVVITNLQTFQNVIGNLEEETEVTLVIQRKGMESYKQRTISLILQGR